MAHAVYSPDEVLEQLQACPPEARCANHKMLLKSHELQLGIVEKLKAGLAEPSSVSALLADYVQSLYLTVSSLPGAIRFNQLEFSLLKSGLLAPFIADVDLSTKRMEVGLPTNTEALCDTVHELLVVATAAFCCFWHYLNYRHVPDSIPSDDAALMLTTLALRSLSVPEVSASFDRDLAALGVEGFTSKEYRWLMHWVRSELTGWFASVQYLLGDERCQESLVAQQQDRLMLIKQVPDNVLGYLLYARSCLQFQQHRAAHLYASKAIVVADAKQETVCKPQLMCIQALASALGGAGPAYIPKAAADTLLAARVQLKLASDWLPAPYHDLLTLGIEAGALSECVLGISEPVSEPAGDDGGAEAAGDGAAEAEVGDGVVVAGGAVQWVSSEEELAAAAACSDVEVLCGEDLVYTTPVPKELPVGAITQLQQVKQAAAAAGQAGAAAGAAGQAGAGAARPGRKAGQPVRNSGRKG